MNSSDRVVTNSFWLIAQPLVLNVASLFVVGYMARTLGQADYGKFVFAFAYVSMFAPLANMGLRAITVREIAKDREHADRFLGSIVIVRLVLSVVATLLAALLIRLLGYPIDTRIVVYLAASTIVFQAVATTFYDAFQAFEIAKYMAYAQFLSGMTLTVLSIVVLALGWRLYGLTAVYVLGSVLGTVLSYMYGVRNVAAPRYAVDFAQWKGYLVQGAPFFFPNLITLVGAKVGVVLLSGMSGDSAVGVYGAANMLVERLAIVPDGICTAMYPAMVILFRESREETSRLFRRFYLYLLLLGLPLALGTTVLAQPIIRLVYGARYDASARVLQVLIWWLFFTFLTSILYWTLAAIDREHKAGRVAFIVTPVYVALNLVLIPVFHGVGAAVAALLASMVAFALLYRYVRLYLVGYTVEPRTLVRALLATGLMVAVALLLRNVHVMVTVVVCAASYVAAAIALRLVSRDELRSIALALGGRH